MQPRGVLAIGLVALGAVLWGTYLLSGAPGPDAVPLPDPEPPPPAAPAAAPKENPKPPTTPGGPTPAQQGDQEAPVGKRSPDAPWSEPGYGMTLETSRQRRRFLAADKDPLEAAERQERIAGRLGPPPPGARLHEVDCRDSGCRVILIFDDDGALDRNIHYMRHLRRALGVQLGVERHDMHDGGRAFGFYLD